MNLILIFLSIFSISIFAQTPNYDEGIDLEAKYEYYSKLEGDENKKVRKHTKKLKNWRGNWVEPDENTSKIIKEYRDLILEVADIYQVKPEAIAGAILAEHTLNYDLFDDIQNGFANMVGIETADKIILKSFNRHATFGFAQVNVNMSGYVQNVMKDVEPELEFDYKKEIKTLSGSVRIIAAIMRGDQKMYMRYDIDISESPGIAVTVFNLGRAHLRAKETWEEKRDPGHNYMGLFVLKYMDHIQQLLYPE